MFQSSQANQVRFGQGIVRGEGVARGTGFYGFGTIRGGFNGAQGGIVGRPTTTVGAGII